MKFFWKRAFRSTSFPSFVLLLIFILLNTVISKGFLSGSFFDSFLNSNAAVICVAIGSGIVITTGGIDISAGAIVTLINVVFVQLMTAGWPLMKAVAVSLVIAALLGALNGLVIAFFRVNPLLATFATSSIFSGLALWILPIPGGTVPDSLVNWYSGFFLKIPISVFFILLIFLLAFLIRHSPLGIWLYALGKNMSSAYVSGVPVRGAQMAAYIFSGFSCGVAAIVLTANVGGGDPTIGLPMTMTCIAACVIGGYELSGGIGESLGAVFGVAFFELVTTTVFSMRIEAFKQDFISGVILLVSIFGAVLLHKRINKNEAIDDRG